MKNILLRSDGDFYFRNDDGNYYSIIPLKAQEAIDNFVHVSFVCDGNGTISGYFNGEFINSVSGITDTRLYVSQIGRGYSTSK